MNIDSLAALADQELKARTGRDCGECQECCHALGIPTLQKPPGVPCQHADANPGGLPRCLVHGAEQPRECASFFCAWREGFFPEDHRPDRCGILAGSELTEFGRFVLILTPLVDMDDRDLEPILDRCRAANVVTVVKSSSAPGARVDVYYPDGACTYNAGRTPESGFAINAPVDIDLDRLMLTPESSAPAMFRAMAVTGGIGDG